MTQGPDNPSRLFRRPVRAVVSTCLLFAAAAPAAYAEPISFQVDNVQIEQVVSAGQQQANSAANPALAGKTGPSALPGSGSSSVLLQQGEANAAGAVISGSDGAAAAALQAGSANTAIAVIEDSPGSKIGQVQIGTGNVAAAAIVGGGGNTVATAQIGSGLGALIGLVDSVDTTITYGQAGQNYNGGIIIKNAPPGTSIKVN